MKNLKIPLFSVILVALAFVGSAFMKTTFTDMYFEYVGPDFEVPAQPNSNPLDDDASWTSISNPGLSCDEDLLLCQIKVEVISGNTPQESDIVTRLKNYYDSHSSTFPSSTDPIEINEPGLGFDFDIYVFLKDE